MLNNALDPDEANRTAASPDAAGVGEKLRQLRQVHDMSQRKLAKLAGITNGAISMIEQDRVSPSIASLKKVLEVFGLSMADFFAEDFKPDTQVFYRTAAMTRIADGPVVLRQVGGSVSRRKLQVLHESYDLGGDTGPTMLSHEGEEAGVIVRGQIEITVGAQCEVLGPGDGYYFNSRLPHRFRNLGPDECEIVSVCTPPTF